MGVLQAYLNSITLIRTPYASLTEYDTTPLSNKLLRRYILRLTVVDHLTIGVSEVGKKFTIVTLCKYVVDEFR